MESLLITPAREEDMSLIQRLLERINARFRVLSEDEKEDIGLLSLMAEGDPNDTVPEEEVMRILRRP
ncbi:MAG TPA: hypothetical protein VNG29_02195 [Candidatus Paceibacterota bacterium]|nr:hypothetical protein [Candidatus Kapabacteria bacterium]HUZ92789.1 hypothetical protein [Candidatus Paceibacterota bacterium]